MSADSDFFAATRSAPPPDSGSRSGPHTSSRKPDQLAGHGAAVLQDDRMGRQYRLQVDGHVQQPQPQVQHSGVDAEDVRPVRTLQRMEGGQPVDVLVRQLAARPPGQLLAGRLLRGLGRPGGGEGAVDGEVVRAEVRRELPQIALDGGEGHAVVLKLLDQGEPRQVPGPVVPHPAPADRGRRKQSAGAVEADRTDGHAGPGRQLVDGEGRFLAGRPLAVRGGHRRVASLSGVLPDRVHQYCCLVVVVKPSGLI